MNRSDDTILRCPALRAGIIVSRDDDHAAGPLAAQELTAIALSHSFRILGVLPTDGSALAVREIATLGQISETTVRRHLKPMVALGVIDHHPKSSTYTLAQRDDHDHGVARARTFQQERQDLITGFARNLRRLREDAGLSQHTFSHRARLSRNHIARLEQGRAEPKLLVTVILADALQVTVDDLVTRLQVPRMRPDRRRRSRKAVTAA